MPLISRSSLVATTLVAASLLVGPQVLAQHHHAHDHGRLALDVAIDAGAITITMAAPLDNFLGFERAPRTDAERKQAADAVATLRAGERLFVIDAAAMCRFEQVTLASDVLGLSEAGAAGAAPATKTAGKAADAEHADIDASYRFACPQAAQARRIDVKLFEPFRRIRTIDVRVASPQGQFKRTLRREAAQLNWGR